MLYVDVTNTWGSRAQTGIQRVVRKVVESWIESEADVSLIVYQSGKFHIISPTESRSWISTRPESGLGDLARRALRRILSAAYLRISRLLPSAKRLKNSLFLGKIKRKLNRKTLPDSATTLLPDGATILLLDIVSNVEVVEYLKQLKESKKLKLIYFSYDCNPIFYPDFFIPEININFKHYLSLSEISTKIWSISQTAENQIKGLIRPNAIFQNKWLPPTPLPACSHRNDWLPPFTNEKYILMVGSFVTHKNHKGLINSLISIHKSGVKVPKLYLVGAAAWISEEIDRLIKDAISFGLEVVRLDNIDDCCLGTLYENCAFTVLPSFVEGFGLPIIESLMYGKPVVTSTSMSMGELLALPGTIGFNHEAERSLESVLLRVLTEDSLLKELTAQAKANAGNLGTWDQYADELYRFATNNP